MTYTTKALVALGAAVFALAGFLLTAPVILTYWLAEFVFAVTGR